MPEIQSTASCCVAGIRKPSIPTTSRSNPAMAAGASSGTAFLQSSGRNPATRLTPPIVVLGSRREEIAATRSERLPRVDDVELEVGVRRRAQREDAALRSSHAEKPARTGGARLRSGHGVPGRSPPAADALAFLPDPLPEEQIARIANVIRHSPSGGYSQGASAVVVTDPVARLAIARGFTDDHPESADGYIATAPVHLVISANESLYHARYNEPDKLAVTGGVEIKWPVPYWFVDAGAVMMAVLMAAIDEGLASASSDMKIRSGYSTTCSGCLRRSSRSASR